MNPIVLSEIVVQSVEEGRSVFDSITPGDEVGTYTLARVVIVEQERPEVNIPYDCQLVLCIRDPICLVYERVAGGWRREGSPLRFPPISTKELSKFANVVYLPAGVEL